MYDDTEFGTIIKPKKTRETQDEGPVSKKVEKKKRKNLNRSIAADRLRDEYESRNLEKNQMNQKKTNQKPKINEDIRKKIAQIKSISPDHKDQTILNELKKHNYDINDTLNALLSNVPEDQEFSSLANQFDDFSMEVSQKKQKNNKIEKNEDPEMMAHQLMSQFYDQLNNDTMEMNSKQFNDLFEQIAYIIKQDQKQKGFGIYEINSFVDDCFSIKDTLLEGLEQIYIDEDDPLVQQTQQFLEQIIKKKVVYEQQRQNQFPTLSSLNKDESKNEKKNYIKQIQDSYQEEKKKEDFFTPSKVPTNIVRQFNNNYNSIYNIGENPHAYADIQQLSKQFNGMSIDSLKFIHHQLHDLNTCKIFLQKYYPDKKYKITVQEKKKQPIQKIKTSSNIISDYSIRKSSMDADLKNMSLKEVREQLDHLFKLKSLFKLTKTKTTNVAYRKQLERLSGKDDARIQKLCEICRHKLIEQMASSHPQYVDLHGYREQQVDDTLDAIRSMIRTEFKKGNSKLKTQKYGSNVYVIVNVMTGKGRHSNRYGKSVLKIAVKEWAQYFGFKVVETEDSVNVYIQLI